MYSGERTETDARPVDRSMVFTLPKKIAVRPLVPWHDDPLLFGGVACVGWA